VDKDFTGAGNSRTLMRFANISSVGPLEFEGIAATSQLCDDGYALYIPGGDLSRFRDGNGALLLQHDSNRIIGTASLRKTANEVLLRGKFASPGVSQVADDARALLKDGVLRGLSMSFSILKSEPLGKSARDGRRATQWRAEEVSLVAVGMDPNAVVTQRALSQLLARSGRRLSAETERCLRAALEHHRSALHFQKNAGSMIEELLARDEDMGGGDDGGERSRLKLRLEIMKRRQDGLTCPATALQRVRTLRELERLRATGAKY
jgi:hypothetical protein